MVGLGNTFCPAPKWALTDPWTPHSLTPWGKRVEDMALMLRTFPCLPLMQSGSKGRLAVTGGIISELDLPLNLLNLPFALKCYNIMVHYPTVG